MSYGDTVTDKGISDRNLFERAAMYIPGYRGYRNKNIRREVDKEVRREVVRSLTGCKNELSNIQRNILSNGDVANAKECDRVKIKTDTYLKRIESAEAGYSGLWEAVKTLDEELKAVVEWDARLLEGSAELKELTSKLLEETDGDKTDVKADIRKIERLVDELTDGLNERIKVLKGLTE